MNARKDCVGDAEDEDHTNHDGPPSGSPCGSGCCSYCLHLVRLVPCHDCGSARSDESMLDGPVDPAGDFLWNRANTAGTKTSVAIVAHNRPPMTARPRGAFCSPPSPRPRAIGSMPIIMASAVMMTGLNRVVPASRAAFTASPWTSSLSLAKETTRMLLAVATPTHISAPMSAGTLSVVWVKKSMSTMPAMAAGRAVMMMKGSSQD